MSAAALLLMVLVTGAAAKGVPPGDFPVPAGAKRVESAGGATSLGPGRNYTRTVYETTESFEQILAFYERRLPGAKRTEPGTFGTPKGTVRVERRDGKTWIVITAGPK